MKKKVKLLTPETSPNSVENTIAHINATMFPNINREQVYHIGGEQLMSMVQDIVFTAHQMGKAQQRHSNIKLKL